MLCIVSCTIDSNFRVSSAVHTLHNAQSLKWLKHWNSGVSNELQWNTVHEVLPFQCFNTWVIAVCSVSELDKKHWMTVWDFLQKLVCMQVEQQQAWGRIIEQQHSHWSSWTIHIKYIQDISICRPFSAALYQLSDIYGSKRPGCRLFKSSSGCTITG